VEIDDIEGAKVDVDKSGIYVLLVASCDPTSGQVVLNGFTEWMNPYGKSSLLFFLYLSFLLVAGYLPADEYGALPFFGYLSLAYLVVGLCWMAVCMVYRKELLQIQVKLGLLLIFLLLFLGVDFPRPLPRNDGNHHGLF